MSSTLAQALDRVVDALTTAGIRASTDPRNLRLPGAWVTVHDIADPVLCGGYTIRADVCLITGDAGAPLSIDKLGDMFDRALEVLTLDEPARPATVTPPGMAPCPALVITTTTE
ncbi:hypothetical protein SEA_COEUR_9 [Gordonia phage Coeur]|uniref:Uncharacterized protein n=1 Tax=Gordonia phage Coeur TaxID=2571246 RepID=A0A4Y6EH44_9CAUD|nr:hypothetical protein PQC60_gp09 [Gordonia phage Coeur]QDF17427.1 hypothetical protein SEA_COEUR_9 [Gordonia phage Coeur]WNO26671.1 tail terminator [Gordonia phage Rahul]